MIDRCQRIDPPRGFTLLELMLSMVLMSALLAATWTLLGIFRDRFDRSQQQTEQWQLIRSLQKTVERDLRSCQMPPAEEKESANPRASSAASELVDSAATEVQASLDTSEDRFANRDVDAFASSRMMFGDDADSDEGDGSAPYDGPSDFNPLGSLIETDWLAEVSLFVGTRHGLIFDMTPPAAPGDRRPPGKEPDMDRAELPEIRQRAIYLFSDPRTAYVKDRPAGLVRCLLTNRQLTLARHFGTGNQDLLTILMPALQELIPPSFATAPTPGPTASIGSDIDVELESRRDMRMSFSDLHQRIQVHRSLDYAPEVATWSFRYFDGDQWRTSWDSREDKSVPVAVEIRFQLAHEIRQVTTDAEVGAAEFRDATNETLEMEALDVIDPLEPVDDEIMSTQTKPIEDHRYLIYMRPAKTKSFGEDGDWADEFGTFFGDEEREAIR